MFEIKGKPKSKITEIYRRTGPLSGETSRDSTEAPKIGVFVCHCGKNIAGTVDVKKVVEEVKDQPNVVVATDYMFMCSKQGIELIKDSIKNKGINRTVVASCSKTQHGKTFAKFIKTICRRYL
ncbi:MAG: hypothetical protein ACTSP4_02360 [Candidatus Hodarchaeales archaeon]